MASSTSESPEGLSFLSSPGKDDDDFEEDEEQPQQQQQQQQSEEEEEEEDELEFLKEDIVQKKTEKQKTKRRKVAKNEFIDDEAELSGDDEVSEDELDNSDDDEVDLDLVDKDAKELDSDEEEEVRALYHKQLESEDKRALLLMREQLEEKEIGIGERRRRKFRWQTKELMENSLKRHYDPDDDDSQSGDEDYDCEDYSELAPRLRRPTAESLLIGSTRIHSNGEKSASALFFKTSTSSGLSKSSTAESIAPVAGPSKNSLGDAQIDCDDSNSRMSVGRNPGNTNSSNMNRFLYRDKELVEALSTKEIVILTREEKERNIERELKRVQTSKSIFDQLYS